MANCDDAVMGRSSGVEAAVDEGETAEFAESPALADKQPREKTETITKTERQEGHFMAGSPLNQKTSRYQEYFAETRDSANRVMHYSWAWDFWPPIPMPPKIRHLPGLSKEFRISSQVFFVR
jgi:hypothetical protein